MKTITTTLLVLVFHSIALAGAIEDGAVRPDGFDLLSKVVRQLNGHKAWNAPDLAALRRLLQDS